MYTFPVFIFLCFLDMLTNMWYLYATQSMVFYSICLNGLTQSYICDLAAAGLEDTLVRTQPIMQMFGDLAGAGQSASNMIPLLY